MARLDYYAIEEAIKTNLESYSTTNGFSWKVHVEDAITLASDECPGIYIYLDRRDAPIDLQTLANGTRTNYRLTFSIWCVEWHFDTVRDAVRLRDDLIGNVELALMSDRTIGGNCKYSWLEGGEMGNYENDGTFLSTGQITLIADGVTTL